jgi:hypothetical protein
VRLNLRELGIKAAPAKAKPVNPLLDHFAKPVVK